MTEMTTALNSRIIFISAFFATFSAVNLQASDQEELSPSMVSCPSASSSSSSNNEIPFDTQHPLIKSASDNLLVDLTKGQEIVKEALRGALEKKLVSNYQPLATLSAQARDIGLDGDKIATKAFHKYFRENLQKDIITLYLKQSPIKTTKGDYYTSSFNNRFQIAWKQADEENVHKVFDNLPLSQWTKLFEGGSGTMPLFQKITEPQNADYFMGMKNAEDVRARGITYLTEMRTFVSSKRDEYKRITFGK